MKRQLLLSLPLALSLSAAAQVELKMSDIISLHEQMAPQSNDAQHARMKRNVAVHSDNSVDMIIRYNSESTLDAIRANGGEIVNLIGTNTAIVNVTPKNAVAVAASKGVTGAGLSRLIAHTNNSALPMSNVTSVLQGVDLPQGYDGTGVVLGLFDTGIDPNHLNFKDADGNLRVTKVFEYEGTKSKPTIYDSAAKISTFESDSEDESHGTHVLGIMGGSYYDSTTPNAPDYRGIARGAELVVACGPGYNAQILDGIERIAKYAQEVNKPCVINLSYGDNLGPHDGSDEFTEAINNIASKYDAVICLAAGNERDEPISIVKTLTDDDDTIQTILWHSAGSTSDNCFQAYSPIDIWTNDDTPFDVTLDIITRTTPIETVYSFDVPVDKATYLSQGSLIEDYVDTSRATLITEGTKFHDLYTTSYMGGVKGVDDYNNCYYADLDCYLESRTATNASKYVVRLTVKGKPGKKYFVYCNEGYMNFSNRNIAGLDVPDGNGTNSSMACGTETICVGSYVSANIEASGYPEGVVGDISYFSSFGETLDGRVMPDICAPGQVIISSRNHYMSNTYGTSAYPLIYSQQDSRTREMHYWTTCAGTSQATPHVAGIAALWRQANPDLTHNDIQNIARQTAVATTFSSPGWGYGKIDALAGIKMALSTSALTNVAADNAPESLLVDTDGNGSYTISAPGRDSVAAALYNMSGMEVFATSANSDELTLNTANINSGIYLLKVTSGNATRTLKIAIK